jgi:hypothetical protein
MQRARWMTSEQGQRIPAEVGGTLSQAATAMYETDVLRGGNPVICVMPVVTEVVTRLRRTSRPFDQIDGRTGLSGICAGRFDSKDQQKSRRADRTTRNVTPRHGIMNSVEGLF